MAFLVGTLAAGVPTVWVATRFQERIETKIAAIRVRLSLLETSHAQCRCEPNSTKRLLGDFPPWYGERPGGARELHSPDPGNRSQP